VNAPASYFIVALNQSAHPAEARAFVELVRGPEGRAILARHGFLPAADAP
jgi:ABC-type molybdate transport system substrate-binding protein